MQVPFLSPKGFGHLGGVMAIPAVFINSWVKFNETMQTLTLILFNF